MDTNTKSRALMRRLIMALALLVPLTVLSPASAEIEPPQATSWGLATEGPTDNLDRWDALGWATEQVGGTMLVGGKFLQVTNGSQTIDQPWVAAFDAGTGQFLPWWRPDSGGAVLAIENSPDGAAFIGGEMGTWNGVQVGALVKIDPVTGDRVGSFATRVYGGGSVVRDVRLEADGWLYVVGNFTTASDSGTPRPVQGAIRLNPVSGAIDWNWLPAVENGEVWGVSVSPNRSEIYLAGWFRSVDGQPNTDGFVGVSDTTGAVLRNRSTIPYNTCVDPCTGNYRLYDVIATEFGDVWVIGEQHALFILDETTLDLRLNHWTGCDLAQQVDCGRRGGEFQELERSGDRIYGSGHFWGSHRTDTDVLIHSLQTQIDTQTGEATGRISAVGAYDVVTGERDQAFNPTMSGDAGGFGLAMATDGCLWMAGGIDQVGEIGAQIPARDLVRLCDAAGPGPDPSPNPTAPAPMSCSASVAGTEVSLSWIVPDFATDVVVYRDVDGGGSFWRGRVSAPDTSFTETAQDGSVNAYEVRAKYEAGVLSPPAACAPAIDLSPQPVSDTPPPASCSATNTGVNASLSWAASPDAIDYRVLRSIDDSPSFWRGRVTTTSFNDTLQPSGLHEYEVQARGASGVWSSSTTCSPVLDPTVGGPADVAAPANCSSSNSGVDASVTWSSSLNATEYRVLRSVDGGTAFWRGLVTTTSFDDTLRTSGLHAYEVQARGVSGVWSASTPCGPALNPTDGGPGPIAAPASCSAVVINGQAEITWPAVAGAIDYRVFRSIDGGTVFWRGLSASTAFTDSLRPGLSHQYSVQARGENAIWSASTACTPAIVG